MARKGRGLTFTDDGHGSTHIKGYLPTADEYARAQRVISTSSALAQTVSHPFIIGRLPAAFIATCAPSTGTGR